MGNVLNPAYVPGIFDTFRHPFSFVDRAKNLFQSIALPSSLDGMVRTPTQTEVRKIYKIAMLNRIKYFLFSCEENASERSWKMKLS